MPSVLPETGCASSRRASGRIAVPAWGLAASDHVTVLSTVGRHERDVEAAVREATRSVLSGRTVHGWEPQVVAGSERRGAGAQERFVFEGVLLVTRSVSTVVLNFCLERIPVLGCPTARCLARQC